MEGALHIAYAIFWCISLIRTKIALPRISKPSVGPLPESKLVDRLKNSAASMSAASPNPSVFWGNGSGDSLAFYAFPQLDTRKKIFHQCAGTVKSEYPPPYRCGRDTPQHRCLHQTGHHLAYGIRGRLVCLHSISHRVICSYDAVTGALTFEPFFANMTGRRPLPAP